MSYGSFEDISIQHRLQLMRVGFRRLHRWLTGKNALTVSKKFRLWRSCILPILTYGIFAQGVTKQGILQAVVTITKMLRQILGDHAYLTRHTHSIAFQLQNIPAPLDILRQAVSSLLRTVHARQFQLQPGDIVLEISWEHLDGISNLLDSIQVGTSLSSSSQLAIEVTQPRDDLICHLCGFQATDVAHFRRHCTVTHQLHMSRSNFCLLTDFMEHGLPQCRFCKRCFTTWRRFKIHIEMGCQELLRGPSICLQSAARSRRAALGTIAPAITMEHVVAR